MGTRRRVSRATRAGTTRLRRVRRRQRTAGASHGAGEANYTVEVLGDPSPGATEVRYGLRVVGRSGVGFETLTRTSATYEAGSRARCDATDGGTFGVDRGATGGGDEIDEILQNNINSVSGGENGASTYLDDGDAVVSVIGVSTIPTSRAGTRSPARRAASPPTARRPSSGASLLLLHLRLRGRGRSQFGPPGPGQWVRSPRGAGGAAGRGVRGRRATAAVSARGGKPAHGKMKRNHYTFLPDTFRCAPLV